MKWIYILEEEWDREARPVQCIYLRPTQIAEDGDMMVGKMVKVLIIATDFYFELEDNPLDSDEFKQIYFEELNHKDYHIVEREVTHDYELNNIDIFLKQSLFDEKEMMSWVDKVLLLKGYEKTSIEKATMNEFMELHPIMQLFSLENAKKFEDKFGKEWWKKDK